MNDPHVEWLEYELVTSEGLEIEDAPAWGFSCDDFRAEWRDGGILRCEMTTHFASAAEAQAAVEPFLTSWQVAAGLAAYGRVSFALKRRHVIDRAPPPGSLGALGVLASGVVLTAKAEVTTTKREYPRLPVGFVATPDVEAMWNRMVGYHDGREPLQSAAYFCLTVLERRFGNRRRAGAALNASQAVLSKIGELTSTGIGAEGIVYRLRCTLNR